MHDVTRTLEIPNFKEKRKKEKVERRGENAIKGKEMLTSVIKEAVLLFIFC